MSDALPELPMKLFMDVCDALGYDPGLIVSIRMNQGDVVVVHQGVDQDLHMTRHRIAWEDPE